MTTLPGSGSLTLAQVADAFYSAPGAATSLENGSMRACAQVPIVASSPYTMGSFYGRSIDRRLVLIGNSPGGPGYVQSNWGSINDPNWRGATITQAYFSSPPNTFTFATTHGAVPISFFKYLCLWSSTLTGDPVIVLDTAAAAYNGSGFWTWTSGGMPAWASLANGTSVGMVLLY